jgi:2-phospho-L-lactate transferase/gluconeogenesis factor (CofD/UPF0052 family)
VASINVVVFSGGRGTATILKAMAQHPQISVTSLVNAYDDGLSTGRLRAFVPGMLGPSDLRKNMGTLMPLAERCHRSLKTFLDHRLPVGIVREQAVQDLECVARRDGRKLRDPALAAAYHDLSTDQSETLAGYCRVFLDYERQMHEQGRAFDYGDCAVGNLLFTGCYLECGSDFNETVRAFSDLCEIRGRVLNVTDGRNYVLVALKDDGFYLPDETAIVSPQQAGSIREIFLLDNYLTTDEVRELEALDIDHRLQWLRSRSRVPVANPAAIEAIREANLIIYGPGTQHSSLYPSYLTADVGEALAANSSAQKVFVANITHDYDITAETVQSLVSKFVFYATRRSEVVLGADRLMTRVFVQEPDSSNINRVQDANYLQLDTKSLPEELVIHRSDWEAGAGRHGGGQILDKLLVTVQDVLRVKVLPPRYMVTIVVPVLNEAKTIGKVLDDLVALQLPYPELAKDIVVVDGGSTDGSFEIVSQNKFVRLYRLEESPGRGSAIRLGMRKARGNVIVTFPSDDEYVVSDIIPVIAPILDNSYAAVFGSRAIKCINLEENIRKIYGTDRIGFAMSKYGGRALSILSLLLFNRYVTDPLSSLKAFDADLVAAMDLKSNGVDLETELVAKLARREQFILEVPVSYTPRTKAAGKKTTWRDGVKALMRLFALRWARA